MCWVHCDGRNNVRFLQQKSLELDVAEHDSQLSTLNLKRVHELDVNVDEHARWLAHTISLRQPSFTAELIYCIVVVFSLEICTIAVFSRAIPSSYFFSINEGRACSIRRASL